MKWQQCSCGWWSKSKFCPSCGTQQGGSNYSQPTKYAQKSDQWQGGQWKASGKGRGSAPSSSTAPTAPAPSQPSDNTHSETVNNSSAISDCKTKINALQSTMDALPEDAELARNEIEKLLNEAKIKLHGLMPPATQLAIAMKSQRTTEARRQRAKEALDAAQKEFDEATKAADEAGAKLTRVKTAVATEGAEEQASKVLVKGALTELTSAPGPEEMIPPNIFTALKKLQETIQEPPKPKVEDLTMDDDDVSPTMEIDAVQKRHLDPAQNTPPAPKKATIAKDQEENKPGGTQV